MEVAAIYPVHLRIPGTMEICLRSSFPFSRHLVRNTAPGLLQRQSVKSQHSTRASSVESSMKHKSFGGSWRLQQSVQTGDWRVSGIPTDAQTGVEDLAECEVVLGKELTLGHEEEFEAHLAEPVKNRNGSGVLLLTDVEGLRSEETRNFAYRLACFGYSVLVPDLFRGRPWEPAARPKSEYENWRSLHPAERVAADIEIAAKYLRDTVLSDKTPPGEGKIALLGFCFGGGRLIETLAEDTDGCYSAGVFFYGTRFDTNLASSIRAPLLLITGDADPLCPADVVKEVENSVKGSKSLVFPGQTHAFAHRPKSMEEDEDAEVAFIAAKKWLHEYLLSGAPGPWDEEASTMEN